MIVTVLDARGVQDYIYGSNRLRDNIGGSELARKALELLPDETLQEQFGVGFNPGLPARSILADHGVRVERFYAGGGNAVYLFCDLKDARRFATEYSARLRRLAPGLRVACAHHEQPAGRSLAAAFEEALLALGRIKARHGEREGFAGLGITLPCVYTGRAAFTLDDSEPISYEIAAKRDRDLLDDANTRIKQSVPEIGQPYVVPPRLPEYESLSVAFELPVEFEHLGRTHGETSYIGVIHLDGNDMASRFASITAKYRDAQDGNPFIEAMRGLSAAVNAAGQRSLQRAFETVRDAMAVGEDGAVLAAGSVALKELGARDGGGLRRYYLPMRFLVHGGDDITIVCDGRLALPIAAAMLEEFESSTAAPAATGRVFDRFTACAGVALVKTRYPFARAYAMADSLCRNAKQHVRKEFPGEPLSGIDWHLTAGGVETDIGRLRELRYRTAGGASDGMWLAARPYVVGAAKGNRLTWQRFRSDVLDHLIGSPTGDNPDAVPGDWARHQSKLKGFATALRAGEDAARAEIAKMKARGLPDLTAVSGSPWNVTGFSGEHTPLLDALELLDLVPHSQLFARPDYRSMEETP